MKIIFAKKDWLTSAADALVLPVAAPKLSKDPHIKRIDEATGGWLKKLIKARGFQAKRKSKLAVDMPPGMAFSRLVVVGLGKAPEPPSAEDILIMAGGVIRGLQGSTLKISFVLSHPKIKDGGDYLYGCALGAKLGGYSFNKYRSGGKKKDAKQIKEIAFFAGEGLAVGGPKKALDRASAVANGVLFARDLVNEPANVATPAWMAGQARALAKKGGPVKVTVTDVAGIRKLKMGLFLAVAQGAPEKPHLIKLEYKPKGVPAAKQGKPIVLVGKGLMYDTGGLSLKPSAGMQTMKCDMAGSAAVLGAFKTLAALKPKVPVIGLIGACINAIDGHAYKLGDIITGRNGKTVEIHNTDAEGRLTLADVLTYGAEQDPKLLIDLATLTGACVVALGDHTYGVMGNDDKAQEDVIAAAGRAGEDCWKLPLNPKLRKKIDSPYADLKNVGDRWGGALTAGLFLKEFVGKTRWVHLDIAGPAFYDGDFHHIAKGGSGAGVMTLVELIAPK